MVKILLKQVEAHFEIPILEFFSKLSVSHELLRNNYF